VFSCKQASQIISQSLDRQLTWTERFNLRLHLLMCTYCARFRQQLITLRSALTRMSNQIEQDETIQLPSETKARIAKELESV
jgi:hypothetical protein